MPIRGPDPTPIDTRTRRYHELFRPSGAFCRHQFLADYTISIFGFDFRQGQKILIRAI